MPSILLDARVVRTRAALRDALLALLEQKPFDQITIRDITAKADAGYATFFRHYETKNALLDDLISDEVKALIRLTFLVMRETDTATAARTICTYIDQRRTLWTALLTGGAAGALREEFMRQAREIPTSASMTHWLPCDLSVMFGVGATVEVLAWWLQKPDPIDADAMAAILDRLVLSQLVVSEA
jgi:AcrR family transcriptional regulator